MHKSGKFRVLVSDVTFPRYATKTIEGTSYRAVENDAEDRRATGLRYYDSSPYLLVQTDNQGGLKSDLIYLPDLTKKRQAHPYNFLATNNTSFSFEKGVLTENSSDTDATAVPVAVVQALSKIGQEAVKALAFADTAGASAVTANRTANTLAPSVYLFKIVKRAGEWGLVGAEGGGNHFR